MHVSFLELGSSESDRARLRDFYDTLYTDEFPDPDERESLENMESYLRSAGSTANAYHIVLVIDEGETVGGCITDYFADSNAGAIEFLVVSPALRGRRIGSRLLQHMEQLLIADAARIGKTLTFIVAEIDDPFQRSAFAPVIDPFERALWWDHRGYGRLDFPYVQPALSSEQRAVHNLMLGAKTFSERYERSLPEALVAAFVRDYFKFAMRIDNPTALPEYAQIARWLHERSEIPIVPLRSYVGDDSSYRFEIREIADTADQILEEALATYAASFSEAAITLPKEAFRDLLALRAGGLPYRYHLWALIDSEPEARTSGMASFFTFGICGFGGYIAIVPPMRGNGTLRSVLARIERQMILDAPLAEGWFIECADEATASLFARLGFGEIDLAYRQPPLSASRAAGAETLGLRLMFKRFGRSFAPPQLETSVFLRAIGDILRFVYGVTNPHENPTYLSLTRQTHDRRFVPFGHYAGAERAAASHA